MCEYVTLEKLKSTFKTADKHGRMKEISKHKIENSFDNDSVPLSDNIYGIHEIFQPEGLHTFWSGIYENLLDKMHDAVGVRIKNTTDKESVNDLHC